MIELKALLQHKSYLYLAQGVLNTIVYYLVNWYGKLNLYLELTKILDYLKFLFEV